MNRHLPELRSPAQSLRELPTIAPPNGFSQRIMDSLPRRRGILGRLEFALKHNLYPAPPVRQPYSLLPANPFEFGMALLIAGVFFLSLLLALLVSMYWAKAAFGLVEPELAVLSTLVPMVLFVLVGTILLLLVGWNQLMSPHAIVFWRLRLRIVGMLFGATAGLGAIGLWLGGQPAIDIIALWMGVSGLIVTLGLTLTGNRKGLNSF